MDRPFFIFGNLELVDASGVPCKELCESAFMVEFKDWFGSGLDGDFLGKVCFFDHKQYYFGLWSLILKGEGDRF